jgi:hypothetical protein
MKPKQFDEALHGLKPMIVDDRWLSVPSGKMKGRDLWYCTTYYPAGTKLENDFWLCEQSDRFRLATDEDLKKFPSYPLHQKPESEPPKTLRKVVGYMDYTDLENIKFVRTAESESNTPDLPIPQHEGLTPAENVWDFMSRPVPEDGYDAESELAFVMGKNVFFKEDFIAATNKLMWQLYDEIKHGDDEHQKWLREKMEAFIGSKAETSSETAPDKIAEMLKELPENNPLYKDSGLWQMRSDNMEDVILQQGVNESDLDFFARCAAPKAL